MKRSDKREHRVWVEIERHNDDEINVYRAAVLSTLLKNLGYDVGTHAPIWWWEEKQMFCVTTDIAGSFLQLAENGHWFSLEKLAGVRNKTELAEELRDVNFVLSLAVRFMSRAKVQRYKPNATGDKAAIEFFAGALAALEIAGMKKALEHVSMFAGLVLQPRGMSELMKLAAKEEKPKNGIILNGDTVDVSNCPKDENGDFILDRYIDGKDYKAGEIPIWSIGKSNSDHKIRASVTGKFYQNADHECVWLR